MPHMFSAFEMATIGGYFFPLWQSPPDSRVEIIFYCSDDVYLWSEDFKNKPVSFQDKLLNFFKEKTHNTTFFQNCEVNKS